MRVIAGSARGRILVAPPDNRIRPTSDRIKEALFSILTSRLGNLSGLRILDIFAGTGNLGIEAMSRGADTAVFIDNNRESTEIIKKNLAITGFTNQSKVMFFEALTALRLLEKCGERFQLIFLDPPYEKGHTDRVLEYLDTAGLVDHEALVVAEYSTREVIPSSFTRLRAIDRRVYGDTVLSLITIADPAEE